VHNLLQWSASKPDEAAFSALGSVCCFGRLEGAVSERSCVVMPLGVSTNHSRRGSMQPRCCHCSLDSKLVVFLVNLAFFTETSVSLLRHQWAFTDQLVVGRCGRRKKDQTRSGMIVDSAMVDTYFKDGVCLL